MIDFRSDTVTQPCDAMRAAMSTAVVGDDVYGEDPTITHLEEKTASLSGHEAALFLPTGTQSNLIALLSHCERGDEYIVGQNAHTYRYEAGGAAVLGSIQPQPIEFEADGTLDLNVVESKIKPDDFHFARTKLLSLENTVGGKVISRDYIAAAAALSEKHGLAFHLDGARVFNAAVAQSVALSDITGVFDSVSICMSKGLGAPVGSVLCGDKVFIARSRRWRKMLGGGMRQAGILAAACIYALDNNVAKLKVDHANAKRLSDGLKDIKALTIADHAAPTNMVFASMDAQCVAKLVAFMAERGVQLSEDNPMRLVTHNGVSEDDINTALAGFRAFFDH